MKTKYNYPTNEEGEYICPELGADCPNAIEVTTKRAVRNHMKKYHQGETQNNLETEETEKAIDVQRKMAEIRDSEKSEEEKIKAMEEIVKEYNEALINLGDDRAEINYDVDSDYILLIGLSDLHYGNKNVDMDYVDRLIDYIENNENVYCFLNGDIIDNWVKLSPNGGIYEQVLNPEYQLDIMNTKLKPIKNKIVAVVTGNHENRSKRQGERNPAKVMAKELGVPYLGHGGRLIFHFSGGANYVAHVRHRYKYNSSINPTHGCVKLVREKDAEADIIAVGHNHEPAVASHFISGKQRSLIRFGSSMPSTSFSESLGYADTPLKAPCVVMKGDKKSHHPFLSIDIAEQYLKRI
ncbi:MAG: metallophosphoesterase [archaeon]